MSVSCVENCASQFSSDLSPSASKDFNALAVQRTYAKGTILFQEDEPSSSVMIICNGQVKLSCASHEGRVLTLRIALPGDLLGIGAVISRRCHEITAKALTSTVVKSVRTHEFHAFLERHPHATLPAARALSKEYMSAFRGARRLALIPSVEGRLAAVLLNLGEMCSRSKGEIRFTMLLTHEELATFAGTTRETVTRVLKRLQDSNLIRIRGSAVTIVAPSELEQLAI